MEQLQPNIDIAKVSEYTKICDSMYKLKNNLEKFDLEILKTTIRDTLSINALQYNQLEFDKVVVDLKSKYDTSYQRLAQVIDDNSHDREWYKKAKKSIDPFFWDSYKEYLIDEKNFAPNIVTTLGDDTLDNKIMPCFGDPNSSTDFLKRGLIIGDVQSGKTSTYIGLMCKAADAGYKTFILLTGVIEKLRCQTQIRIEEGFIGVDNSQKGAIQKRVGVGLQKNGNRELKVHALTSREHDFIGKLDGTTMPIDNNTVVFVLKKNMTTLTKLYNWLCKNNLKFDTDKIASPMVLIDDESDNASINTKNSSENNDEVTKINGLIRKILSIFKKSNYIGFTATPYANVFIDPNTESDMLGADLFPENFIITLPTPSNYIGATSLFGLGDDDGKYTNAIRYIRDVGERVDDGCEFYNEHKKDWNGQLPNSLKEALYTFYVANAIRCLRGDEYENKTMLINMSRFVDVQQNIANKVEELHKKAYRDIKYSDCEDELNNNPVVSSLIKIYKTEYAFQENCFSWNEISKILLQSIDKIQIKIVNQKNKDALNYNSGQGNAIIAIGGLALSRGLTLEGLLVSYVSRNTRAYDVLMQMGRFFGYRHNYDDLFRVWLSKNTADWYSQISDATELLKDDMEAMNEQKKTPKDFGIRVRRDCNDLQITSRNKMRNTNKHYELLFYGDNVETPYLERNIDTITSNYNSTVQFLKKIKSNKVLKKDFNGLFFSNVEKKFLIDYIRDFKIHKANKKFEKNQLLEFLNSNDNLLDIFDVFIPFGNGKKLDIFNVIEITTIERKVVLNDDKLDIGMRGKVGSPNDGKVGISDEQIQNAQCAYKKDCMGYENDKIEKNNYPTKAYFKYLYDRKPIFILYIVDMKTDDIESDACKEKEIFKEKLGNIPLVALGLGCPNIKDRDTVPHRQYTTNQSYDYYQINDYFEE